MRDGSPAPGEAQDTGPLFRLEVAVAAVSATLLALQIAFSRILSVVVHFHLVFLVVSVAMLGVGLPGAWFAVQPPGPRTAARALLVAAASIPLSVVGLFQLGSMDVARTLSVAIVCLVVPFLSLGTAAAAILLQAPGAAFKRVYAADLFGGAVGALGVILLLDWAPTPALVACLAWPAALGAAWLGGRSERVASACVATLTLALVLSGAPLRVRFTKGYDEVHVFGHLIEERWSSTTRLAVFDRPIAMHRDDLFFTWGPGTKAPMERHPELWIEQDGSAGTPVVKFDGDLRELSALDFDVTSLGYQLRPPKSVLVVGPGGGRDLLSALRNGAEAVQGVEVNRGMIELMTGPLAGFSGNVYRDPRVTVELGEARSYLARTDHRFDALQISLIDSFAATAAGAHVLSEGYLYTVEAMRTFLRKLGPNGLLSISRWDRESFRLLGTLGAALDAEGLRPVKDHLLAARGRHVVTVLASASPFSEADQARAAALEEERGWAPVLPPWDGAIATCVDSLGNRCGRRPVTDDDPFFFIYENAFSTKIWGNETLEALRRTAAFAFLALVLSIFAPLFRERRTVSPRAVASGFYFVVIGVAFMFVEVGLTHRFVEYVGHPTTSAAVVLTGILFGAGAGSYFLSWRASRGWMVGTSVMLVAVGFGAPSLFEATRSLAPALRALVGGFLSAGAAFQLGAWFPAGVRRFGDRRKAWFWLVNGTASVAGGMLAIGTAIDHGFRVVFAVAALLYFGAAALLLVRPEDPVPGAP